MSEFMTVREVLQELRISRSTFYYWRQLDIAPVAFKLPNGELRVRRSVLDEWIKDREAQAA